mgnify:CR=1 FL=1
MFGGVGIYLDGVMPALVVRGTAYLKVDARSRGRLEGLGAEPFTYARGDGKTVVMSFLTVPDAAWEDGDLFEELASGALEAARRTQVRR